MREVHEKISIWAFWVVIAISILALAGWITDVLTLSGMGKNSVPMAPFTLLCFMMISFAALNLLQQRINPFYLKIVLFFVLVVCLIIFIDSTNGYPIDFENVFGSSPGFFGNLPIGRMSPVTSILFLIGTISLLTITAKYYWHKLAIFLSTTALFAAFIFDLGYLYRTPLLYGQSIIPPAWNTSLAFTFLFLGILTGFGMNEKPLNLFVGESVRARLMRGFLPPTLLIIVIAGWLDTIFFHYSNDHVLATALVTLLSLFALIFIILKLTKNIGNEIDHIFAFQKKAEEAMRESELHFRTLANSGQALIWTSGIDKKCNYFNQPWLDFTGRSLEQELGDGWVEGVHPDDLTHCLEVYSTAYDHYQRFSRNYRLRCLDGTYHWIQDNGTPRFNVHGKFIGYVGHCLDITNGKLAEKQLKESEEKYRSIFENSSVAILFSSPDGSILSANNFACSLFGMTETEICQAGRKGIIDLSDPRLPALLDERKKTGHARGEITFTRKDGTKFECELSSVVFTDSEGKERTSMVIRDLTEQKQAEQEIVRMAKHYQALIEKAPDGIVLINGEGDFKFLSPSARKMFGYLNTDEIMRNPGKFTHPDDLANVSSVFYNIKQDPSLVSTIQHRFRDKNGEWRWVESTFSNLLDDPCVEAIVINFRDITDRKAADEEISNLNAELEQKVAERTNELEKRSRELLDNESALLNLVEDLNLKSEELQQSTAQLKVANKELEAFSYSVSHDLRAPLRAISGFVSILLEDYEQSLDTEGKRICSIIYSNAIKMGQLIDDLLSFSRLIRSEFHQSKIDMESLVKNVISEFETTQDLSQKNILIQDLPSIIGDTNMIKQVWINLISNAIKYSSKNENVQITIGSFTGQNEFVYYIKDNGVGFNMNYVHKLFGVFHRLHSMNEFEGTGVGLAIVQRIISRHDGRVWAEGEVGNGATFYFTLPAN